MAYDAALFAWYTSGVLRARQAYDQQQIEAAEAEVHRQKRAREVYEAGLLRARVRYAERKKVAPIPARQAKSCGSTAAYTRHLRRNEDVDEACREAHNEYNRINNRNWRERRRANASRGEDAGV